MTDIFSWSFSFLQVLMITFITYHIAEMIGEVRATIRHNKAKKIAKVVKIEISVVGGTWYAFEEDTKKFLVQSLNYEDLQKKLNELCSETVFITNEEALNKLISEANDVNAV